MVPKSAWTGPKMIFPDFLDTRGDPHRTRRDDAAPTSWDDDVAGLELE